MTTAAITPSTRHASPKTRTGAEITDELHALKQLTLNPAIQAHDEFRDDLAILDRITAQIQVIEEQMSYDRMLEEYEDSEQKGADYILDAAHDAFRWLHEDDEAPSSHWDHLLEVLASIAA